MKKWLKSKSILLAIISVFAFSAVASADMNLYQLIKDKLTSIGQEYISKDSALTADGQAVQADLQQYYDSLAEEIRAELDSYEQQQTEQARKELFEDVQNAKSQINAEKQQIINQLKEQLHEKIQKDLENEKEKIKI